MFPFYTPPSPPLPPSPKTPENKRFSGVFRGNKMRTLILKELKLSACFWKLVIILLHEIRFHDLPATFDLVSDPFKQGV